LNLADDAVTGAFNVTPLLRKSAAERVVAQIVGLIRSGNIKPGDQLPTEANLASAFQVSRPVVR
jgi:GntR family transcriptional repressor for pyruvate dehydrogenase complex